MEQRIAALQQDPAPKRTAARLLDLDPELGEALSSEGAAHARLPVAVERLSAGAWDPETTPADRRSALGILVVDGLLAREVAVAGGGALELLGAGDIVNPWDEPDAGMLVVGSTWTVLVSAQIAVFDPRTVAAMSAVPQVLEATVLRAGRRATRLAVHQAISQLPRVEQRVLTLLWFLSERWGRMTANGVLLPLPLNHSELGRLVGARRPTVSLAVKELATQELLTRRDDGTWVLAGEPPEDLARVRPAPRREHIVEVGSVQAPIAALAERVVALRGRSEQNLHIARDVLARAEATRADAQRLITRPRPLAREPVRPRPARRG